LEINDGFIDRFIDFGDLLFVAIGYPAEAWHPDLNVGSMRGSGRTEREKREGRK
jgi:hypothetical protein